MSWKIFDNQSIKKSNLFKAHAPLIEKSEDFLNLVKISGELNREIYLEGLTPEKAQNIERVIRFWNTIDDEEGVSISERQPIKIYIDSLGGSLSAAFTIIDAIKLSKAPVYTVNIGNIYKESFFVYLAGHKRYSYPRATFLYERDLRSFDAADVEQSNFIDFSEKIALELKDMLIEKTKIKENEYEKRKTWWLTAEKAYELNICNEVLRIKTI